MSEETITNYGLFTGLICGPWCSPEHAGLRDFAEIDFDAAQLTSIRETCLAAGVPESRLEPGFHKRMIEMTGSDDTLDRYNSRILVDGKLGEREFGGGWQLANFVKNPVFMPVHEYKEFPIGQSVKVYSDAVGRGRNQVKRLRFVILFADETENPLAERVLRLYRGKFLRASSVGFSPKKAAYFAASDEEATELGLPVGEEEWPRPRLLPENELLELSAVPIPGNPNVAEGAPRQSPILTEDEAEGLYRFADETADVAPELAYEVRSLAPTRRLTVDLAGGRLPNGETVPEILDRKFENREELTLRLKPTADPTLPTYLGEGLELVSTLESSLAAASSLLPIDDESSADEELKDAEAIEAAREQSLDFESVLVDGEDEAEERFVPKNVSSEIVADKAEAWKAPTLADFTDKAWDDLTDAEKNRIAGHFAYADAAPPSSFGALKLGHHRPSDGRIVFRGVIAAIGRLNQTGLPENAVSAVRAHLNGERARFQEEDDIGDLEIAAWKFLGDRAAFEVQTLIFPKRYWTLDRARSWLDEHELRSDKVDETVVSFRFRQKSPSDFVRLRTMCLMPGGTEPDDEACRIKAVGGPMREAVEFANSREDELIGAIRTSATALDHIQALFSQIDGRLEKISDAVGANAPVRTPEPKDAPPGGGAEVRGSNGSDVWGEMLDIASDVNDKLKNARQKG